jgi:Putative auto-transporter adhesin, head GIN domain
MKKLLLPVLILAAVYNVSAQKDIVVDPNAELRPVNGPFHVIRVSGGIDIFLSQSENEAVAVSASEDRFKEGLKTVVENGTLKIYYEGEKGWGLNFRNRKLKVYVSFRNLDRIDASGASDVVVVGTVTGASLSLELSGASDFRGSVKLNDLKMDLSGSSDVKIEGTAVNVTIESSGASDVNGYELISENCNAKVSGASDIYITVNKELNAHASGASDIYYKGNALIREMHASGSSNIAKKN